MNCKFEKGFVKRNIPYKQLNKNDLDGRHLLIMISLTLFTLIILFVYHPIMSKFTLIYWVLLVIGYFYFTFRFYEKDPIRLLYIGGYIISNNILSSPFPSLNTYFPNHHLFESKSSFIKIKKEIINVLKSRDSLPLTKNTFNNQNKTIGSDIDGEQRDSEEGWKILIISTGKQFTKKGLKLCPYLCKIVKSCPEILSCVISILPPHKGIPIHVGYYKGIIRYQLGVIIPKNDKVFLCVNGQKYHWNEGKGVLFDDTFAHKVYNNSDEYRVVIYMDIKREHLPLFLEYLNNFFINQLLNSEDVKKEIKRTEYQVDINESFISGINYHR